MDAARRLQRGRELTWQLIICARLCNLRNADAAIKTRDTQIATFGTKNAMLECRDVIGHGCRKYLQEPSPAS
jgi:hypothetical protein